MVFVVGDYVSYERGALPGGARLRGRAAERSFALSYPQNSVLEVDLYVSIPKQIRQLILYYY